MQYTYLQQDHSKSKLSCSYVGGLGLKSRPGGYPDEAIHETSQRIKANAEIIPKIGHDHFPPHPLTNFREILRSTN
jgi:hypothetical protein